MGVAWQYMQGSWDRTQAQGSSQPWPLLPSNSTICPRNGPKMAKNGLNVRHVCQTGPKPRTGRILAHMAQNRILRAPSPPATPQHFFAVSKPGIWDRVSQAEGVQVATG